MAKSRAKPLPKVPAGTTDQAIKERSAKEGRRAGFHNTYNRGIRESQWVSAPEKHCGSSSVSVCYLQLITIVAASTEYNKPNQLSAISDSDFLRLLC